MSAFGLTRYKRSAQRCECRNCHQPIEPGDFYYVTLYVGLGGSQYNCVKCPPLGGDHARSNYREPRLRKGSR